MKKGEYFKTMTTLLIIGMLLAFNFQLARSSDPDPFSDEFNAPTLYSGWTVIDPDGGSAFDLTINPGWLRITTTSPPGRDLIGTFLVNAPRIVQSISGDFTVETKISSTMDENDEGAGILVWKDSANYLRLDRMSRTIGGPVEQQIFFCGTIGGGFPIVGETKIVLSSAINPTYLKVIRSGNIFSGYYSTDGILWNHVADVTYAVSDPIQTGLDIITVYHDGVFSADFDYFRISGTNPTTPPQIPVGGEWVPIDKSQLLAPWISLVSLMTVITVSFVYVRRKRQQN